MVGVDTRAIATQVVNHAVLDNGTDEPLVSPAMGALLVAGVESAIARSIDKGGPLPAAIGLLGDFRPKPLLGIHVEDCTTYSYAAILVRVVDGDTVRLTCDLGFGLSRVDQSYRFARINAPEMSTPEGPVSKQALIDYLAGKTLIANTSKPDKYGRSLVELYASNQNVNDWLVANNWAVFQSY